MTLRVLGHNFPNCCAAFITSIGGRLQRQSRNAAKQTLLRASTTPLRADPISFTTDAVTTVFRLLSDKITAGEIQQVHHALPADIRALWPLPSESGPRTPNGAGRRRCAMPRFPFRNFTSSVSRRSAAREWGWVRPISPEAHISTLSRSFRRRTCPLAAPSEPRTSAGRADRL